MCAQIVYPVLVEKIYARKKVSVSGANLLMDVLAVLFLDVLYLVFCLEFLNRDDPLFWLRIFGYGQIALPFLFVLFAFLMNLRRRNNNDLLDKPALILTSEEVALFLRNGEKRWKLTEVTEVRTRKEQGFRFRGKPKFFQSGHGTLIFVIHGHRYESGYVDGVDVVCFEVERAITDAKLATLH